MQKYVGLIVSGFGFWQLAELVSRDWRMMTCALIIGIGGVIYGDAEE